MRRGKAADRLVADVGGTNTRIALYDAAAGSCRATASYVNREHGHFEDVIAAWRDGLGEPLPAEACVAVAAPPGGDRVTMTNSDWSFSCRDVARRFGFRKFRRINDFEANAYSLPHLRGEELQCLYPGFASGSGSGPRILATVGPGTGLGGATLYTRGTTVIAQACEPGHMGLSPATERELALFRHLLQRFDNVHAELLVSGPGLRRLYETLAESAQSTAEPRTPEDISREALAGGDPHCVDALAGFCDLLGSVCGDFVLATGAYDGLYLAGGIVPAILPFLTASGFHRRFCTKGAMEARLQRVPIHAVTGAQPGLVGAAHAPL